MRWYYAKRELTHRRTLREAHRESEARKEKELCLYGRILFTESRWWQLLRVQLSKKPSGIIHQSWETEHQVETEVLREIKRGKKKPTQNHIKPLTSLLCVSIYLLSTAIFITTLSYICEAHQAEVHNLAKWQGAWAVNSRVQSQWGNTFLAHKNLDTEE